MNNIPTVTGAVLPVNRFLQTGDIPETALQKAPSEIWRVYRPVAEDGGFRPDWALVRSGELVRIPLIPYRFNGDSSALGQLAAIAAVHQILSSAEPGAVRWHWVVGDVLTPADTARVSITWLGVAARYR